MHNIFLSNNKEQTNKITLFDTIHFKNKIYIYNIKNRVRRNRNENKKGLSLRLDNDLWNWICCEE